MPRKLKDIDVAEISLVDTAANRKKFFIKKQRRNPDMDKLLATIKSWFSKETVTDEQVEKAKAHPEEQATSLNGALVELAKYREDFPPEFDAAVTTLAKAAVWPSLEPKVPEGDADAETLIDDLGDLEKAGAKFSNASLAQLKKIKAAIDSLIGNLESTEKGDGDEKMSKETLAKLARLDKLEKAEAARKTETDAEAEKKRLATLKAEITADVKKALRTGSKQLKGDGDPKEGETEVKKTDEDLWPSLVNAAAGDAE